MSLIIRPITADDARAMETWRYLPPYDHYNVEPSPEHLAYVLDAAHRYGALVFRT